MLILIALTLLACALSFVARGLQLRVGPWAAYLWLGGCAALMLYAVTTTPSYVFNR